MVHATPHERAAAKAFRRSDGGVGANLPAPARVPREGAAGPSGHAREGPGHLADLDVAPGRRRGPRVGLRARGAGVRSRHAPRDHRRQPSTPVLVDARGAGGRRHRRADVPGRARRRLRVRPQRRRDRVRDRRGPGAGRQDARGEGGRADARAHLLRRPARPAQLRGRDELRAPAGDRPRVRPRESRLVRRAGRARATRRRVRHALHVRHDGKAEGRAPDARRIHRRRAGRVRVRPPHRRRQHPVVPADGVGGRSSLLDGAVDGRGLHDQLPRVRRHRDDRPARDRPHLLLRAAARVREPAHAGDDPDGGCERNQARAVPSLHGSRAQVRRRDTRGKGVPLGRAHAVRARQRRSSTRRCATCSA